MNMQSDIALKGIVVAKKGKVLGGQFYVLTDAPLAWKVRNALRWSYIKGEMAKTFGVPIAKTFGLMTAIGELRAIKLGRDGIATDHGVVDRRVVTTAFCAYMVDQMQTETSTWGDFKYHDSGVGTTDPAVGDTGIETTDGESRATGTQTEGTSVQYRSVATISYTTTKAITEHGLFNDASAGTLLDRSEFAAINVVNGDAIQFSYTLDVVAGG